MTIDEFRNLKESDNVYVKFVSQIDGKEYQFKTSVVRKSEGRLFVPMYGNHPGVFIDTMYPIPAIDNISCSPHTGIEIHKLL